MTTSTVQAREATGAGWLVMVILVGAMVQSLVIGIHETVHALSCLAVGHEVVEYSALHVACQPSDPLSAPTKLVSGSAAVVNVVLGALLYSVLRGGMQAPALWKWFLWLLMFANWSNGFGYLIFSGISGAGDYATVIEGWQPAAVWQVGMLVLGSVLWLGAVYLSLRVLGRLFGGEDKTAMRNHFLRLGVLSYIGAVVVIICAGLLNRYGLGGLPAVAGIMAAAGTLSPLLWMPFWFTSDHFAKQGDALRVRFDVRWLLAALVICLVYVLVLGRGVVG